MWKYLLNVTVGSRQPVRDILKFELSSFVQDSYNLQIKIQNVCQWKILI